MAGFFRIGSCSRVVALVAFPAANRGFHPFAWKCSTRTFPHGQIRREESRARLFGRARYLDHPEVAADDLSLRGHHLHGRSRPGRGARAGTREGDPARHQAGEHLHRGPARGVRARLRVSDVPRQHGVRGPVPARHLGGAAADRQKADRDRREARRRRRGAWRDRQGQRPGALRAGLLRAQARRDRDRAMARMGPDLTHAADRIRRAASDSDRQGQEGRSSVFGRRQPAAHLVRRQGAGRSRAGRARLRLFAHRRSREGARDRRP